MSQRIAAPRCSSSRKRGQTKDQQEFDQFTCSKWAKEQTGIDPNQTSATATSAAPEGGQALRGAAGGAALGAIGGAIGGDAGRGAAIGAALGGGMGMMRRYRAEMQYEEQVQEQAADRQAGQQKFNRAYSVCLEGRLQSGVRNGGNLYMKRRPQFLATLKKFR